MSRHSARIKSFTQPLCWTCWYATETRHPVTVKDCRERCCDCGKITYDGIYTRRDPKTVNFPRYEVDE